MTLWSKTLPEILVQFAICLMTHKWNIKYVSIDIAHQYQRKCKEKRYTSQTVFDINAFCFVVNCCQCFLIKTVPRHLNSWGSKCNQPYSHNGNNSSAIWYKRMIPHLMNNENVMVTSDKQNITYRRNGCKSNEDCRQHTNNEKISC